jgi:hypothetical protein
MCGRHTRDDVVNGTNHIDIIVADCFTDTGNGKNGVIGFRSGCLR